MDTAFLDYLLRVVAEKGQFALWRELLPWIAEACGASAARVTMGFSPARHFQYGRISETGMEAIERWEESLRLAKDWVPRADGSLSTSPPVPVTSVNADCQLLHTAILEGSNTIMGGASLVFAPDRAQLKQDALLIGILLQTFARLGVLAEDRYRMQRRLTQLNLLYEISRAITSTLEVETVLAFTTELAASSLGTDVANLMLIDPLTGELAISFRYAGSVDRPEQGKPLHAQGVARWVAQYGQPLIVNSTERSVAGGTGPGVPKGVRNVLCVPLLVKGTVLGALEVQNKGSDMDFGDEDLDWLSALAAQTAIAIENARLYSSLREERDRILELEEEIRRQLARDLHDSTSQLLSSILLNLEVARRLATTQSEALPDEFDRLRALVVQANLEVRRLVFKLRPLVLENRGLVAAVEMYLRQHRNECVEVDLITENLVPFANRSAEAAVFMIVQEAFHNICKHADASQAEVHLCLKGDQLEVVVQDDGRGFDLQAVETGYSEQGSLGLLTMRERAEHLDGTLTIESPPPDRDCGTRVTLSVPIARLQ